MLITLCLLLSGQFFYEKYVIKDGLYKKISQVSSINDVRIAKHEAPPTVYVSLNQNDDLQTVYNNIEKIVQQQLGTEYKLVLLDNRTPRLKAVNELCQFPIQEAIATGNFQEMRQKVKKIAEEKHIDYSISVDSYNVYLSLKDQNGYLYEIIPRYPLTSIEDKPEKLGS